MGEVYNQEQTEQRRTLRGQMPAAEVRLWSRLRGRQVYGCKFRRQFGVGPFVLDFYSPEIKLGIELDGESHFREGAPEYDRRRQEFIEQFDVRLVRFLNTDVFDNLDGALEMIGREIILLRGKPTTG